MAIGSPQWMYASGEDAFTIDQSLRFNDDDSAYLSWTPSSAGNRRTWTWSGWVKRGNLTDVYILNTYTGTSSVNTGIWIEDDKLKFYDYQGGVGYKFRLITTRLLRDPSAWMHIMCVLDTAETVEGDRAMIYINGIRETAFDTEDYPSLDFADADVNNSVEHQIGQHDSGAYLDGYLAEVNFIDGTALTPSSFGETGDYGEWKPIEVSGLTYGTNGFYLPFDSTQGIIAATGGTITTSGDYKIHTFTADGTFTPTTVPASAAYVQYLVVAGGGASGRGYHWGGGGGAGGMREGYLEVSAQGYSITVGDGGVYGTNGGQGENSVFSSITSTGGGAGQSGHSQGSQTATTGGSGGGAVGTGAAGVAGQGFAGGTGTGGLNPHGGGGGGASEVGSTDAIMDGGDGKASSISGSSVVYAGGGAGRREDQANGTGGTGGGGSAANGSANTGGGGGSSSGNTNGGSGIVIIKYRYQ